MSSRFLIIGAGFSDAVIAQSLAERMDCKIDVWKEKPQYRNEAEVLNNVFFLGRSVSYHYMDMHYVINQALRFFEKFVSAFESGSKKPVFPNNKNS